MEADNLQNDPKILMQLAKAGDAEAFGRLYELYFTPVFRYIYFRVKDKEEANDLAQTVFLKVFSALPNFREQNKSPLAYFFTVSRNTVIDYWRGKKEIRLDDPESIFEKIPDKAKNPIELAEEKDISRTIHSAILELTDIQQEVIVLKFINDLSNKEISELMEKTEDAIRQLQCRAMISLRQILKNQNLI
ncbi:MAG: sigma-70 family RNA polymerase sigma factor [Candidatus Paceibacterota bacterium]|jgi:RNA polymerase sigma-70 factor (ECF subfamily)